MDQWEWIEQLPKSRRFLLRVLLKAILLFVLCNVIFALAYPMTWLSKISLYGSVLPYRQRLPYGEVPEMAYNVTVNSLEAMFASHVISRPKGVDELRVVIIGDSSTWGWLLTNEQTVTGALNQMNLIVEGHPVSVYNLGYPDMSLSKDLLILEQALAYDPDLIIWLVTLASFPVEQQLALPLVQHHSARFERLSRHNDLGFSADDTAFYRPNFWERTLIGQRRGLADLIRLQTYGFVGSATEIDQAIPSHYDLRQRDFEADYTWSGYRDEVSLDASTFAFTILDTGMRLSADVPVVLINEPMYISDGIHSQIRYNSLYPRWAYDQYRVLLQDLAVAEGWHYYDLWNWIDADEFTDSPVHLSPRGAQQLAGFISDIIINTK